MPERKKISSVTEHGSNGFTVHQLTVFRTVARYLSYTQAARALYLSQPAVAQQVKTLELVLGLQLFMRRGRGIVLTEAGQEFLSHTERLLTLLAETTPVVHEIHTLGRGSVVIGADPGAGTYVVPPLLGAFHARYPGIHVTLMVERRHIIEELLVNHQIDLGVMNLVEPQEHFAIELLRPYELVVVASLSHQLAGYGTLSLRDLHRETLLLHEQESLARLTSERHFGQAGVTLPFSLELGSIEAAKEGVAAGLGIAILPRESIALELASGDLVVLDVQGFPLQRQWNVVHFKNRRLSLVASALRRLLLQKEELR